MKHRLFVAIPLPEAAKKEIAYAIDRLEPELPAGVFRFSDPELWHITVSFLGDQDDSAFTGIIKALSQVITAPELIKFTTIGYGPSVANPDMIWLMGDKASGHELEGVRNQVNDLLFNERVRFSPDNRPLTPHVTLARSKGPVSTVAPLNEPCPLTVPVEELQLIESVLTASGPEYTILNRFPLL